MNAHANEIDPFADLDDHGNFATGQAGPKVDNRQKFPCQPCAGTGSYRGARLHQSKAHCFACKGEGFFFSSHADRVKKRTQAATRKRTNLEATQAAFAEQNPGIVEFMAANAGWSSFIRDMQAAYGKFGALTEGQLRAVRSTQAKVAERDAARKLEREARIAAGPAVDLSPIHVMFAKASAAGLKRLAYRAEGLTLAPAKATSANAGAIYVTRDSVYLGKVVGEKFVASREATDADRAALLVIAANPAEAAAAYGKATGTCSCCGRELTDPVSIANGIGPICADKWF